MPRDTKRTTNRGKKQVGTFGTAPRFQDTFTTRTGLQGTILKGRLTTQDRNEVRTLGQRISPKQEKRFGSQRNSSQTYEHGLRSLSSKNEFRQKIEKEKRKRSTNSSLEEWTKFLQKEIDSKVIKSGVHPPEIKVLELGSEKSDEVFTSPVTQEAAFDRKDWKIYVNANKFQFMDEERIHLLANSIYHEARHAEQSYWGAWFELNLNKPGVLSNTVNNSIKREIIKRIRKNDFPKDLDLKLTLGKKSSESFEAFERRSAKDQTREAYLNDFHEVDARSAEPLEKIGDSGQDQLMGEGSDITDYSDRMERQRENVPITLGFFTTEPNNDTEGVAEVESDQVSNHSNNSQDLSGFESDPG